MLDVALQVALMLAKLYGLSCTDALKYTQAFHDSRRYPQNVRSPQTAIQRTQVSLKPGLMASASSFICPCALGLQLCPCQLVCKMHTQVLCIPDSVATPVSACCVECLPYPTPFASSSTRHW